MGDDDEATFREFVLGHPHSAGVQSGIDNDKCKVGVARPRPLIEPALHASTETRGGVGVSVGGEPGKRRLTHIELDDCGISGALPDEIAGFDHLQVLALDGNQITEVPAAIGALASMEQCYLSNNLLETVPPELGDCVSLETLWLNGNQLKKIPKEIGNLVALETLDLSDNQLETLPKELANLDLLEQLDIYNNAFTKMPKALAPDGDMEEEGCNIVREEP